MALNSKNNKIQRAIKQGLAPLRCPPPMRLSEWAEKYFYLSAESSYAEGVWRAYPYQVGIMDAISNDDIKEIIWKKPARVGYTKILLAAVGYYAQHKKRNQAIWQPTDDDRDEFTKVELNSMLRDCDIMREVFPQALARAKENTLQQKMLLGSTIHLRGGKAAKNYRRLTVDVAVLDELDGFDLDIEQEGSPDMLAAKRLEGATFPKLIMGSTPKLRNFSLIEAREEAVDLQMSFYVPCPACGEEHTLTWGGKDKDHGFKWHAEDPETVLHLCEFCKAAYSQQDYLSAWHAGRWKASDGTWIDDTSGFFRDENGERIDPPASLAFTGLWTAYSPQSTWSSIVRDWINARAKARAGDLSAQKTFTNTTLGETWEQQADRTDYHDLEARAEAYPLGKVPHGGLILVAGVDVQDDRFEMVVWAVGRDEEMWVVDYIVIPANPADEREWDRLDAYLLTEYEHVAGAHLNIESVAIDTGGHFTHQSYNFCRRRLGRRVYAVKGANKISSPIKGRASWQDVNFNGRILKRGVKLWAVGTDTAKDLIYGRLKITEPGPGAIHFSEDLPVAFYEQLTAEARVPVKTSSGEAYRWQKPPSARNEVLDCTVYALFASHMLDIHRYSARRWELLAEKIQADSPEPVRFEPARTTPNPPPTRPPPKQRHRPMIR